MKKKDIGNNPVGAAEIKEATQEATQQQAEQKEQQTQEAQPKKGFFAAVGAAFAKAGKTVWRWTKRTFMGASKELALSMEDAMSVEAIESPFKQTVKSFFRKPLAVTALVIVVLMFIVSFIGPLMLPMDLSYSESYHANLSPGYRFMKVPKALANNVKSISSYSFFSVGVDNDDNLYVWGNTNMLNSANNVDFSQLPQELQGKKVAFASAGYDHAIAITTEGKVVGWGEYDCAQYGTGGSLSGTSQVIDMPDELINGTIDVDDVAQLVCGYQVTAIVMKDGSVYVWGNYKAGASNIRQLRNRTDVAQVEFTGTKVIARLTDGTLWLGNAADSFGTLEIDNGDGTHSFVAIEDYIGNRKVVDIATTKSGIAVLLEDGELVVSGNVTTSNTRVERPVLAEEEKILQIAGGAKHLSILTSAGRVYSFGDNALKQSNAPTKQVDTDGKLFAGAFQSYMVGSDNSIQQKWGCKGYLMGTDELGRDIFTRIVHGGKKTMTIGAVAVIISAVIAIIVGCLSGYFGGWVDMLLMRVTEVFGAIPFLPFALILSAILAGTNISEDTRIFMIMVILGLLSWTGLARMIRGQVLAEREKEFVIAAKAMGIKENRIAFRHILPNVISVILVSLTLDFAGCMLTESSLSYLGFGVKLPQPTWGNMLNGCNNELVIGSFWWRWLFPALFLLITTICINIVGDSLRDVLDPKSNAER